MFLLYDKTYKNLFAFKPILKNKIKSNRNLKKNKDQEKKAKKPK
jgi:hypothetical protein